MKLTQKDVEKLKYVAEKIKDGTATTLEKSTVEQYLESILNPRCSICRGIIQEDEDLVVINDRKMHIKCSSRYNK
jgi:hypothetical protein